MLACSRPGAYPTNNAVVLMRDMLWLAGEEANANKAAEMRRAGECDVLCGGADGCGL